MRQWTPYSKHRPTLWGYWRLVPHETTKDLKTRCPEQGSPISAVPMRVVDSSKARFPPTITALKRWSSGPNAGY